MRQTWKSALPWIRYYSSSATRIANRDVLWKTGDLGGLASGNCTLRFGQTTVFAVAVCDAARNSAFDKVLFQVEYKEQASATARFPRNWHRHEIHQTDREMCIGRSIDRALRPLFPLHMSHDVSVTASVLSATVDDVDPDIVAMNAASGALLCSNIPWHGPVGACRVAMIDGELVVHPSQQMQIDAQMSLTYAGTQNRIVMLEAVGKEIPFDQLSKALDLAHAECRHLIASQWELSRKTQMMKRQIKCFGADPTAATRVLDLALPLCEELYSVPRDKATRSALRNEAKATVEKTLEEQGAMRSNFTRRPGSGCVSPTDLVFGFTMAESKVLRNNILMTSIRPDGRFPQDIRTVKCQAELLPVVHGSAVFERGETQSLCTVTIGSEMDRQIQWGLFGTEEKLLMAAVCGGSLALMDAGVPIRSSVAGISIGLVTDFERDFCEYEVGGEIYSEAMAAESPYQQAHLLTDIQGLEDAYGDMDFKIASTEHGFTALQLDAKLPVKMALEQSRQPLLQVLDYMKVGQLQREASDGPRFERMNIDIENMGLVIGKDGEELQKLTEEASVRVTMKENGDVAIYAPSQEHMEKAKTRILDLQGLTIHEGEVYAAKVVQILDYGAYVELPNGFRVLLHISQLAHDRIGSVEDVLTEGQIVNVKCMGRDTQGNIFLSRKELLE